MRGPTPSVPSTTSATSFTASARTGFHAPAFLAQGPNRRRALRPAHHESRVRVAELLDEFARLRAENLITLRSWQLSDRELALEGEHPELGTVTLRQLLATWVAHDLGHVAQTARARPASPGGGRAVACVSAGARRLAATRRNAVAARSLDASSCESGSACPTNEPLREAVSEGDGCRGSEEVCDERLVGDAREPMSWGPRRLRRRARSRPRQPSRATDGR